MSHKKIRGYDKKNMKKCFNGPTLDAYQVSSLQHKYRVLLLTEIFKERSLRNESKKIRGAGQKKISENVPMDPPKVHTKFQVSSTSII